MITKRGWALKWRSENRVSGKHDHLMMNPYPVGPPNGLFRTRQVAREFRDLHYGYIKQRSDLTGEPHGWKMPQVVKAKLTLEEIE